MPNGRTTATKAAAPGQQRPCRVIPPARRYYEYRRLFSYAEGKIYIVIPEPLDYATPAPTPTPERLGRPRARIGVFTMIALCIPATFVQSYDSNPLLSVGALIVTILVYVILRRETALRRRLP
jgi:hypothetical protein